LRHSDPPSRSSLSGDAFRQSWNVRLSHNRFSGNPLRSSPKDRSKAARRRFSSAAWHGGGTEDLEKNAELCHFSVVDFAPCLTLAPRFWPAVLLSAHAIVILEDPFD
jgi:hypothetical protein